MVLFVILALGVVLAFSIVVPMTAYAVWVNRYDRRDAVRKWRKGQRFVILVAWVLTPLFLAAADVGVSVRETTAALTGLPESHLLSYLAEAVALVAGGVLAGVATYAVYATPAVRYRDLDYSLPRTIARTSAGTAFVGLVSVVPLTTLVVPWLGDAAFVASFVPVFVLRYLAWPWLANLIHSIREPTAAERERLDAACTAADFQPRSIDVYDVTPEEKLTARVTGPFWRRNLMISNYLLATIDDEALTGVVALNAAADRLRFQERGVVISTGFLGAVATAVYLLGWPWAAAGILVVFAGFFAVKYRQRRQVFRMDEIAADLVGAATVLAAFRWRIDTHDAPRDHSRVRTVLTGAPTRNERMRRLTDGRDVDPADVLDVAEGDDAEPEQAAADPDEGVTTTDVDPDDGGGEGERRQAAPNAGEADAGDSTDVDAWGVAEPADGGRGTTGPELTDDESSGSDDTTDPAD